MAVVAIVGGLAACKKDNTDRSGGCEAVDLGLSVKWASYNVGAMKAEGRGSYFAWGETEEKQVYDWSKEGDYKWGVYPMMTKYAGDSILDMEDDPAAMNWGGKWRTPTKKEIDELLDKNNCKWTWDDTRQGYVVMGLKTGNSIFLPAAGYRSGSELISPGVMGYYWSSSVSSVFENSAEGFGFSSSGCFCGFEARLCGRTVRAVTEY